MKQVTPHELRENTGTLELANRQRAARPFKQRRILPAYQELLDTGALRDGTDSTQMIREDRDNQGQPTSLEPRARIK